MDEFLEPLKQSEVKAYLKPRNGGIEILTIEEKIRIIEGLPILQNDNIKQSLILNHKAVIELTNLLQEAVKVDLRTSGLIASILIELGYIPSKIDAWNFLFEQIDLAKKGNIKAHDWCVKAYICANAMRFYPPPLMDYISETLQQKIQKKRKPKECHCLEDNREIAQIIYQTRKVTNLIPIDYSYIDSTLIDEIEKADNKGITPFFEKEFDSTILCRADRKLEPTTILRHIYKPHRRALIILDLAIFATIRALSDSPE